MTQSQPASDALSRRPRRAAEVGHYDIEADVIVVGFGCAGASAAIDAARAGADVLVLERASGGGGTSAASSGILYLGGGTPLQKALGFDDDPQAMFDYLMAASGPDPDERLVRPYCEHSVELCHWLADLGLPFKEAYFPDGIEPPGDESLTYTGMERSLPYREIARPAPRGHCGSVAGSKGALLMHVLTGGASAAGARIETGLLAQRLVQEDDGSVVGIEGRSAGERRVLRARRGVVLTSGGFINNQQMVAQYAPRLRSCSYRAGTDGDDGSGIQMAAAAGGATIRMEAGDVTIPLFPPVELRRAVFVNRYGQRFVAEDTYMGRTGEYSVFRNDGRIYAVMDDRTFVRPQNTPVEVVGVGETWEELEREMELPAGALTGTMELYNRFAEKGEDPLFGKEPANLQPLTTPPFGAIDLSSGNALYAAFTLGGLWIDDHGRVQTPAGETIAGLYAAGRTTSGIAKHGYSSGLSLGDAAFFGRRAGRHAACA